MCIRDSYSKGGIEGDSEVELREAFEKLYDRCLRDLNSGDESSYIFKPVSYTHLDVYKRQLFRPVLLVESYLATFRYSECRFCFVLVISLALVEMCIRDRV